MPHRNLLMLCFAIVFSLSCWAARDHSTHGRRFGDILGRISATYITPVDEELLFESAVDGMLEKLDGYSRYVRPSEGRAVDAALAQEFGGVGIELIPAPPGVYPIVKLTRPDSPAMRAGILSGDRILSVDGRSTRGLALGETIDLLRGEAGSTVRVAVLGRGADSSVAAVRSVDIVRETLRIESVLGDRRLPSGAWDFRLQGRPSIGFLRVTNFGERTADEVRSAIESLDRGSESSGPIEALVIDLRGNPGGLVSAAVAVCDLFVGDVDTSVSGTTRLKAESDLIVSTRGRDGWSGRSIVERRLAVAGDLVPGLPLAVLVDGGTASAAEIMAACLQDHGRASIIGGRTFGKGTVQQLMNLESGGILKLTTSQYFTPSGRPIHRPDGDGIHAGSPLNGNRQESLEWGVTPDPGCVVEPQRDALVRLAIWRERRDMPEGISSNEMADISQTAGFQGDASAAELPEQVDSVLARAISVVMSKSGRIVQRSGDHD